MKLKSFYSVVINELFNRQNAHAECFFTAVYPIVTRRTREFGNHLLHLFGGAYNKFLVFHSCRIWVQR